MLLDYLYHSFFYKTLIYTMKKLAFLKAAFVAVLVAVLFFSCTNLDESAIQEDPLPIDALTELGFDASDAQFVNFKNPITEETSKMIQVEGDMLFTPQHIEEMLGSELSHVGAVGEQYRTSSLVTGLPRTIRVIGFTGSCCALDNTMRTALQWAVNNYNRINTGLNFTLAFGTNYQAYDIVVYNNGASGGGGSAGFPSGGDPHQFVQINAGTSAFGTNVVEHVITHEIGHALGLRHTDYFNRSLSCGSGGNEGSGGVGAIHIPGTPTGFDPNSIMVACFGGDEDGEFGPFDVDALEFLY